MSTLLALARRPTRSPLLLSLLALSWLIAGCCLITPKERARTVIALDGTSSVVVDDSGPPRVRGRARFDKPQEGQVEFDIEVIQSKPKIVKLEVFVQNNRDGTYPSTPQFKFTRTLPPSPSDPDVWELPANWAKDAHVFGKLEDPYIMVRALAYEENGGALVLSGDFEEDLLLDEYWDDFGSYNE